MTFCDLQFLACGVWGLVCNHYRHRCHYHYHYHYHRTTKGLRKSLEGFVRMIVLIGCTQAGQA